MKEEIRLIVLSGPSGAGKSTAMNVLEDMGFFCVDNLPVTLLPKFLELVKETAGITKVSTVVDVREREFLKEFTAIFKDVKKAGYKGELVYLDATDDALVKRFSETRRRHPLAGATSIMSPIDGIRQERELLKDIKSHADKIMDTSHFNVHQLKERLREYFSTPLQKEKMTINLISFGYRYGIPSDADIVMDVRFLPNPHFVDEFKGLDGLDEGVKRFVLSKQEAKGFIKIFERLVAYLVPLYRKEGKSYLTLAIGCTAGRHRSVVMVEHLGGSMGTGFDIMRKIHRDMDKT